MGFLNRNGSQIWLSNGTCCVRSFTRTRGGRVASNERGFEFVSLFPFRFVHCQQPFCVSFERAQSTSKGTILSEPVVAAVQRKKSLDILNKVSDDNDSTPITETLRTTSKPVTEIINRPQRVAPLITRKAYRRYKKGVKISLKKG